MPVDSPQTQSEPRRQRALDRADRFITRLTELRRAVAEGSSGALLELESLVLVARGSAETDHRQELALRGLQAATDRYLTMGAPDAADLESSGSPDALLAAEALREVLAEYPDEAERMSVTEVAAAVRRWAGTLAMR